MKSVTAQHFIAHFLVLLASLDFDKMNPEHRRHPRVGYKLASVDDARLRVLR
jgi:hypothetical protein